MREGGRAVDTVTTRTGFRKTEFGSGLVKLNDRVIQLKGYAQRTTNEWPALGSTVPAWLSDFSNRLMVEWGGGIAQGPDNFILSKTLPVENGVNRVIIRSTTKAGKVTFRATAEGL